MKKTVSLFSYLSSEEEIKINFDIVQHCISVFDFDEVLIVCKSPKADLSKFESLGAKIIEDDLDSSYESYNFFMLNRLCKHVKTDFVLTIQNDGFIINPSAWLDEYLEYDYIGSPWYNPINQKEFRVGNGGFSLRSRKLLTICGRLTDSFKDISQIGNEDLFICKNLRILLRDFYKIKFAPLELAAKFSVEWNECPEHISVDVNDISTYNTFGFHGRSHVPLIYSEILKMKTVILTGCAGLLGANFSRYLLDRGYKVIGIDDLSGGYEDFLPLHENFKFYKFNLESEDIASIFNQEKPDVVFHFAAYAAEGLSPFIREFNYRNNVVSSTKIVNECIKHDCKLIFTSSMAVYGDQSAPFTESMIPDPADPYGVAKYTTEMDIKLAASQFDLKYTIVRPHNILGIYQNIWDIYRNVIGIFIKKVLDGEPMIVYGDGEQTRAFSDIKYLLPVFESMIESHDGELFNIGADKEWTINEVAKIVQEVAKEEGYEATIEHGEERHEVKHAYCDHRKAKEFARFTDETNVYELIKKMFVWAKDQPKRASKKMTYEVDKGIYSYWK